MAKLPARPRGQRSVLRRIADSTLNALMVLSLIPFVIAVAMVVWLYTIIKNCTDWIKKTFHHDHAAT